MVFSTRLSIPGTLVQKEKKSQGDFISSILVVSGLVFASLALKAWTDANRNEMLKNEHSHAMESKPTSILDRLGWFKNWKLRRRLRAISMNWAPLSKMPSQPIERSEFTKLVRLLEQTESAVPQQSDDSDSTTSNVVCVLGEKGSGKTTLFLSLVERLRKDNQLVLPIKADRLEAGVKLEDWLSKELRLHEKPIVALTRLARRKPLVVVVDQLDALASLVDLTSDRLNQLLSFIEALSSVKNIKIVCSCRGFDFHHDVRFQSLNASQLTLELPDWNNIRPRLIAAGVSEPNHFPEVTRDMLRNPQHLKVYLAHLKKGTQRDSYLNYYELLEDLWEKEVNTEPKRNVIYNLTDRCIKAETLDVPYVKFEGSRDIVYELLAADILVTDRKSLGFRHQTMLEYAKARLFVKNGYSLREFATTPHQGGLSRQDSIHVRPTVWTVLIYLRQVSLERYRSEIEELFNADLRLHLRFLLIDFLGQCIDPHDFEIGLLASRLSVDEDWKRVLWVVRNNCENWFPVLQASHLPPAMNRAEPWPMVGVLSNAIKFEHQRVLELMQECWYSDPGKDEQTIRVLKELEQWDDGSVQMAKMLIARALPTPQLQWWASGVFKSVVKSKPELAPQIFLLSMERQSTVLDHFNLLNERHWHDLVDATKDCELRFSLDVWPWFVNLANGLQNRIKSSVIRQYSSPILLQDSNASKRPIIDAIHNTMLKTAKTSPSEFVELVRSSFDSESLLVHQILCSAMAANPEELHMVALEFLLAEDRRFAIGDQFLGDKYYTGTLLTAIGGELSDSDFNLLVDAIAKSSEFNSEVPLGDVQLAMRHADRQILLKSLPHERLSDEIKHKFQLEMVEVPPHGDVSQYGRCGSVIEIPPIPVNLIEAATDEEILESLVKPNDSTNREWKWIEEEEVYHESGGPLAQARALVTLARKQPERIVNLLPKIAVQGNDDVVATVLDGVALESQHLFALIKCLSELGCKSDYFREKCSAMLHAQSKSGLPPGMCALLKGWLRSPWQQEEELVRREHNREDQNDDEPILKAGLVEAEPTKDEKPEPILAASAVCGVVDTHMYWTYFALANGYLAKTSADPTGWLRFVDELIDLNFSDTSWRLFCRETRWIGMKGCDRSLAESVIGKLFERRPRVAFSIEGVQLFGRALNILSPTFVSNYMTRLRSDAWEKAPQAYGELLALLSLCNKNHGWADQELENAMARIAEQSEEQRSVNIGLAFMAANLWGDPSVREKCCRILCRLIQVANGDLTCAIGIVVNPHYSLCVEPSTNKLLQTIAQNPHVLTDSLAENLMEQIKPVAQYYHHDVLTICRSIVEASSGKITSMAYSLYAIGPILVDIALTLQRFDDTRSEALNLFEDLLRIGLAEANAILNEKDLRPGYQPIR